MKRIVFTTLITLALIAACHKNQTPSPTPRSSTVKPEIETGSEVSTKPSPIPMTTPMEVAIEDDFGGTPHDSECMEDHFGNATALLETEQLDGAVAELEKGVYDEPENFEMRKMLGEVYVQNGDLEKAVGNFRIAVDQVDDSETWQELAQVCFDRKDFDEAQKAITKVTKLDPSAPDPWNLLARVYQSKSMWKEAIDASEEAIARGSDSPWTFNNLGYAHLVLGHTDDSVRELEKAVSFDTGVTPAIWNNLGLAYEKQGELSQAAGAYRAALAGNPRYVNAKVNLKRLTEVAKAEGIAIGEKKAEIGPMPTATPTEIEDRDVGEKTDSTN